MAKISITLGADIQVGNVDHVLDVGGQGKLIFSRGSVEWKPIRNSVNQLKFTWPQFAKALAAAGTPVAVRTSAAKKSATRKAPTKKAVKVKQGK